MTTGQKQPTPAPSGGGSVTDLLNQLDQQVNKTSSGGSSKSLYGLGDWGSQNVNPGDLPVTVNLAAGQQNTTGDSVVQAFAHGSPDQVATIQHALAMSGYYPSSYTPKYGVISAEDINAFAQAVKTAGQAGQPVSQLLEQQAAYGATAGIAAAQQQAKQGSGPKSAVITLPNTQDLEAEASAAFQKILGKKATPEQEARFAAWYRSMAAGLQRASNQAEYDVQNPPMSGPLATADPSQVVQQQLQTPQDPTGGYGDTEHNGANVPGGFLNALPPAQKSFSDQIGGLMSLGQAVAASQQAGSASAQSGLTQITEDSMPSASVAAENFARNADPKGAAANDTANVFDTFLGILSKNFG